MRWPTSRGVMDRFRGRSRLHPVGSTCDEDHEVGHDRDPRRRRAGARGSPQADDGGGARLHRPRHRRGTRGRVSLGAQSQLRGNGDSGGPPRGRGGVRDPRHLDPRRGGSPGRGGRQPPRRRQRARRSSRAERSDHRDLPLPWRRADLVPGDLRTHLVERASSARSTPPDPGGRRRRDGVGSGRAHPARRRRAAEVNVASLGVRPLPRPTVAAHSVACSTVLTTSSNARLSAKSSPSATARSRNAIR